LDENPEMTIQSVFAQATVSDLAVSEQWYSVLFDRQPDARPMAGLIEWHLQGDAIGVQVWSEPERAGRSSMVLGDTDLDGLAERLTAAGINNPGPQQVTASRILQLEDPDGNRVVIAGA
jgi:predicted enzyme related to lactoylglutathione lyase